jgi:hypothetical protein
VVPNWIREALRLRSDAYDCRRLAGVLTDPQTVVIFEELADEADELADQLEAMERNRMSA